MITTGLGPALALAGGLAPSDTKWSKAYVLGDKTVVLAGQSGDRAIALRTTDGGRSWTGFRAPLLAWSTWGVGPDGALALANGMRDKVKVTGGRLAPVNLGSFWLAASDATALRGPAQFFPSDTLKDYQIAGGFSAPAVWDGRLASVIIDRGRSPMIAYGAPAGLPQPAPVAAPNRAVRAPYGRPAQMLSVGSSVEVRPWPKPNDESFPGSAIPGSRGGGKTYEQLNQGPGCEFGNWSFQRIADSPKNAMLIGVSDTRSFSIKLPEGQPEHLGCNDKAVVVETVEPENKIPLLVRCTFDGKCAAPNNQPFEIWNEQHERTIVSVATEKGLVAAMYAKTPQKWGLYLAQSIDEGASFELPRTVGTGQSDRFYTLGALVGMAQRQLLLITADVPGSGRRGWYVLASDDNGTHWGPP